MIKGMYGGYYSALFGIENDTNQEGGNNNSNTPTTNTKKNNTSNGTRKISIFGNSCSRYVI